MPKPESSSIRLSQPSAHFREAVSFGVVIGQPLKGRAQIQVACYQNGLLVYGSPGWVDESPTFTLGPTASWSSGAAGGKAALYDQEIVAPFKTKLLAECDFTVFA